MIRSDGQFGFFAKCHLRDTFIPSLNNPSLANNSLKWSPYNQLHPDTLFHRTIPRRASRNIANSEQRIKPVTQTQTENRKQYKGIDTALTRRIELGTTLKSPNIMHTNRVSSLGMINPVPFLHASAMIHDPRQVVSRASHGRGFTEIVVLVTPMVMD
jgi:hypothetical protein